jgi:hypothetical protein
VVLSHFNDLYFLIALLYFSSALSFVFALLLIFQPSVSCDLLLPLVSLSGRGLMFSKDVFRLSAVVVLVDTTEA